MEKIKKILSCKKRMCKSYIFTMMLSIILVIPFFLIISNSIYGTIDLGGKDIVILILLGIALFSAVINKSITFVIIKESIKHERKSSGQKLSNFNVMIFLGSLITIILPVSILLIMIILG